MPQGTTYSFLDTTGSFIHPLAGTFIFGGGVANGIGQIIVENTTERTTHDVSADGVVVVNYIAGDNGSVQIEVQQTSALHKFLLAWFNDCKTAADLGDPTNWATAIMTIQNVLDGSIHNISGISPPKVPPKTYSKQQTNVTWHLMAAQMNQISLPNLG